MQRAAVKRWILFFLGILGAILVANTLADIFVSLTGIQGWIKFVVNFVVYALVFFGILSLLDKYCRIGFFTVFRTDQ